ncbi:MAG: PDZ domain-containing protein [Thermoanaerobaculales bacterium]|nr:PDZ domain-containing protein [Thermoanaerobaculales bacterium]
MRKLVLLTLVVTLLGFSAVVSAAVNARMLRFPDVSETHIAFVYAGDIWVVEKEGGTARRLSSPKGEEVFPRFSPDGSKIAFSGNYDGNIDVYVVPAEGGEALRITHHPEGDRLLDWMPDGENLLFASRMTSESGRFNQLWQVAATGGLPSRLPVPYGEFGVLGPDGHTLAYMPAGRDFRTWKRYRGGLASEIWFFDLEDGSARNVTVNDANDSQPMWHGRTLYFLSDRGPVMRSNIWALDLDSGETRALTHFTDFDVHFPAIGPREIVFEAGGVLYLFDIESEEMREVIVNVVTDEASLRPRTEKVGDAIEGGGISPSGKRVVIEARGELFTVPAEHGPVRNITRTSGERERFPSWSPTGDQLAYWSDQDGEWNLYLRSPDGKGEARQLTDFGAGYRYHPFWAPDGKTIAFIDQKQIIRLIDVESGALTEVDQLMWRSTFPALDAFEVNWSSDSRWLAYSKGLPSMNSALFVFDTEDRKLHQLTSGFYDVAGPVFGAGGDYLFCLVDREFKPSYSDFDGTWIYANATRLAAIGLRPDVASPLAPRSDEEEAEKDDEEGEEDKDNGKDKDKAEGEDESDDGKDEEKTPVEIDFDGIESRMILLPVDAGNFGRIASVEGKLLFVEVPRTGSGDEEPALKLWDFEEREAKTVLEGVGDFEVSADGKKILVSAGESLGIIDPAPDQKLENPLRTGEMSMVVDPRAEWQQIFTDVWRTQRDFFYDPAMHGLDWQALRERYGALIENCVTRWDVNYVIGELIGELNVSHAYRGGGDLEQAPQSQVGLLGVDWERAEGQWRIARIVKPAPWEMEVRSPVDQPGVEVSEGDFVLAVNGRPLAGYQNPWAAFEGLAEQTVELTVNSKASFEDSETVLIETLGSEARLRHLEWIEHNRQRVEEATGGKVGYVFVPDTGIRGQSELVRQYMPQASKEGLIVDERFNAGGQWPDRFVELFSRSRTGYIHLRDGEDRGLPVPSRVGPTVMLVNSWAGSGGDAFPYLFRRAGLGPIIGTRTWGGLVGISSAYRLMDGGGVTLPTLALYTPEGEWMLEGHGLEPDIEVMEDPAALAKGTDPQLERAIAEVQRLMAENPAPEVVVPEPGDRTAQ